MYKIHKIQKNNSFVLLGMSLKAVTIPRSEATLVFMDHISFLCAPYRCEHQLFHGFWNVLSHTGHLKILMPKVFMWEDGYNFWEHLKSATVAELPWACWWL